MIPYLRAAIGIAGLIAAGEGLLLLLGLGAASPRWSGRIDRAVAAFAAGTALVATWSLLLAILGVPASLPLLAVPLLLYPAGRAFRRGGAAASPFAPGGRLTPLGLLAWFVALAQTSFAFREALIRPIHAWDAWRIWSFRAKVLFLERRFPDGFFSGDFAGFPGYPLGIPLVEALLGRAAGAWHEPAIQMLFPFFFAGLLLTCRSLLRENASARSADIGLLLLAASPLLAYHGSIAYMDLPLSFFLSVSVLYVVRWERTGAHGALLVAALSAGFLSEVKNEGLPLALLLTAIVLYRARGRRTLRSDARRWFLAFLPVSLPWLLFKYLGGVPESPYHTIVLPAGPDLANRVADVFRLGLSAMFLSGSWGIAWFVLLFLFLPGGIRRAGTPGIVLAGGALLFAGAYCFTGSYTFLLNGTSLGRNLLVLLPLGVTAGMAALGEPAGRSPRP
jgi:hypothetical protein